jgi:iron complex outermembrane receptor protein
MNLIRVIPAEGTEQMRRDRAPGRVRSGRPGGGSMYRTILTLFAFLAAATATAATINGRVTDAATGAALSHAQVEVLESHLTIKADENGRFFLEAPAHGTITLAVSHPGYRVEHVAVSVPAASPLAIALEPIISHEDRIEVTATRAREGASPVSFTNLSQERIQETYWAQDPAIVLSETAPGYFAYNDSGNGIGYSYFWIRGFNQAQSRVTLNGAPLNDASDGELYFIDLADFLSTAGDVQISRGVYGLSGLGGTVDITTAPPPLTPGFTITSGFGSYNTQRLTTRWDSGLIDGTWAVSARYSKITTDGYRDHSWVDMWNYYLSLARFGERSRVRLVLFGGPENTHLAYAGVPKSVLDGGLTGDRERDRRFNPLTYPGEQDNFTQPHFQLLHDLAVTPNTQLAETFFFFTGSGYYTEHEADADLGFYFPPDVIDGGPATSDLIRHRQIDEWDAGWVPTLTTTSGDWTFTAKGEFRFHRGHSYGSVQWAQFYPPDASPDYHYYDYVLGKRGAALAATATWRPSGKLSLTLGLEGSQQRYTLSHDKLLGVAFSQGYDFLLPRFGAIYHLDPHTDLYFNVARGGHEPACREIYDPEGEYSTERVTLRPEDVWDFEAGTSMHGAHARLRANLFFMNFPNEIVYSGALDSSGVPIYGNGAHSHHEGIEMDASVDPSPWFGLDAALTVSHNRFVKYHELVDPTTVNVYDGNALAGYPDLLGSLTARTHVGATRLALSARYVGKIYTDNSEDNRRDPELRQAPGYVPLINPAFTVVDLAAWVPLPASWAKAVGLSRIELEGRINNLLNRVYTAFAYTDYDGTPAFIPAAERNAFVSVTLGL